MGFLDYIGNKIQQVNDDCENARIEAESWDVEKICRYIKNTSSIIKCGGYVAALKDKCSDMDDYELMNLFEDIYNQKNARAANAIMPIMSERGLAHKDDNGKIIKDY